MKKVLLFVSLVIVGIAAQSFIDAGFPRASEPPVNMLAATVRIDNPNGGHGSGVHLGDGRILTAAHVVEGHSEVAVRYSKGGEDKATVVYVNRQYDFAVIQVSYAGPAAVLSCAIVEVGAPLEAIGNPWALEFVTTRGHASGASRQLGPWAEIRVDNIVTGPGMSGGPVFDRRTGRLTGITVGGLAQGSGFAPVFTLGYSFTLPTSVICRLMKDGEIK